jgi:hypothetical protein
MAGGYLRPAGGPRRLAMPPPLHLEGPRLRRRPWRLMEKPGMARHGAFGQPCLPPGFPSAAPG